MTQDKLESRRAFMKKFGKLAGAAVVPFMAMAAKEAVAASDKDSPVTSCTSNCTNNCNDTCSVYCRFGCKGDCGACCGGTCAGSSTIRAKF